MSTDKPDRYTGLPVVFTAGDPPRPAPFLMSRDDLSVFLRLHDSKTKFPSKTIQRYRKLGLRSIRVGRRVWFRLDDVLRSLDRQQDRVEGLEGPMHNQWIDKGDERCQPL